MKSLLFDTVAEDGNVTLRVRVWIEIAMPEKALEKAGVTLRVRVWIEITLGRWKRDLELVTLRVRVWIEIASVVKTHRPKDVTLRVGVRDVLSRTPPRPSVLQRHPPCEGVD